MGILEKTLKEAHDDDILLQREQLEWCYNDVVQLPDVWHWLQ